jgi:hypothetical protein
VTERPELASGPVGAAGAPPAGGGGRPRARDAVALFALGLAARLATVAWAGGGAMAGDASFYRTLAGRLAEGHGYTWLWPDGAVTAAAHYPVGWPAALAAFDLAMAALPGWAIGDATRHPWAAQAFAAVVSAAAVLPVHALVARAARSRTAPALAAGLVALHPGLVLYAPALMSEGPTATLLATIAWLAAAARGARGARRWGLVVAAGVVGGVATLVRPQSIVMAPIFVALAVAPCGAARKRAAMAALAGAAAIAATALVCAPWVVRNCEAMGRCGLSFNGGWNLLIGSEPQGDGGWAPVQVPPACSEVWDEAAKDACFGRAATARIAADPAAFLRLAPRKLAATFDYAGAGPWWLAASRPDRVGPRVKTALAVVETAFERLLLLACAVAVGRARPRRAIGRLAVVVAAVGALQVHAWIAVLALAAAMASLGVRGRPLVYPATAAAIAATAAVHAVFFGAGRYQIVLFPLLAAVAALAAAPRVPGPSAGPAAI